MARIVVADDDTDIRDLVAFKLEQDGHEVSAFADGEAALRDALEHTPALAVLDVMMPRMTGIEVCRALRDDPRTATVPVLLLTARAQEADVERGFATGATDYMVKPFSPRELLVRVRSLLDRAGR